ncbi:MAG: Wzz/FepE/Etk N-terminal domain-containing protein [Cyclobacteriaceae bacterium]|nr:Wzz/FepE/Etk N-terminal domain-containing protein [Cyclobacteriaceae bacterium]MDX5465394.1 Wzz/FepE/Etk N-terminal domain-containing protein [Cyclobacteriaceae bacterium]
MDSEDKSAQDQVTLNYLLLIQEVFSNRKVLFIGAGIGLFLGILVAFTTPKEYQASSYILLESDSGSSSLGQLGAFAGLAGINMPQFQSGQLALTPEIFPDVIQSRDFLLEISKEKFAFETREGEVISLEEYYFEEKPGNIVKKTLNFIISIPAIIASWFDSPDPIPSTIPDEGTDSVKPAYLNLSGKEIFSIGELKKRIEIEQKGKMIRLNVMMPEPLIAAQVNAMVLDMLITYVTEYKVGKQKRNIEFIEERVAETEQKFSEAQMRLASFRDSNQGIISQRVRTREEQLEFEFNIAYNVYNSLKQELEQARIQLKKETPIFTPLERATLPLGAAKPNKPLILIFSLFFGLFLGVLFNLYNILIKTIH